MMKMFDDAKNEKKHKKYKKIYKSKKLQKNKKIQKKYYTKKHLHEFLGTIYQFPVYFLQKFFTVSVSRRACFRLTFIDNPKIHDKCTLHLTKNISSIRSSRGPQIQEKSLEFTEIQGIRGLQITSVLLSLIPIF